MPVWLCLIEESHAHNSKTPVIFAIHFQRCRFSNLNVSSAFFLLPEIICAFPLPRIHITSARSIKLFPRGFCCWKENDIVYVSAEDNSSIAHGSTLYSKSQSSYFAEETDGTLLLPESWSLYLSWHSSLFLVILQQIRMNMTNCSTIS